MTDEAQGRLWLRNNLHCSSNALELVSRFAVALRQENERQNLIARGSVAHLWWRHIVDSAQLLLLAREFGAGPGPWMDLGSGAGFPGLIIAILDPSRPMLIVEQRRGRVEWLCRVAEDLALSHVRVLGSKLEMLPTKPVAIISARAFAPLPRLLELSNRFSTPDTIWLLPKGEGARQEVEALSRDVRAMFHVKQSATNPTAGVIVGRGISPV